MLGAAVSVVLAGAAAGWAVERGRRGRRELRGDVERVRARACRPAAEVLDLASDPGLGVGVAACLRAIAAAETPDARRAAVAESRCDLRLALDGLVGVPRAMARVALLGGGALALVEAAPVVSVGAPEPAALGSAGVALLAVLVAGGLCLELARRGASYRADRARAIERLLALFEAGWTGQAGAGSLSGAANLSQGSLSNRRPAALRPGADGETT
ncbi:MAG: hypothetical protein IT376_13935 [Polyangiaceae bacterium]|nr:hypothetical protein [Polyangiaceae bacterium]